MEKQNQLQDPRLTGSTSQECQEENNLISAGWEDFIPGMTSPGTVILGFARGLLKIYLWRHFQSCAMFHRMKEPKMKLSKHRKKRCQCLWLSLT